MSVAFFQDEACRAYKLLDLFELSRGKAVKEGTAVDELRRRVTLHEWENAPELGGGTFVMAYIDGIVTHMRMMVPGEVMTDPMILAGCRSALQDAIEPELMDMRLVFEMHGRLALRCPDLLSAMYYQFAALVDRRRPTAICPGCNGVFEKTRRDKEHCNDTCRKAAGRRREREEAASSARGQD
jgi:hypothetical protein